MGRSPCCSEQGLNRGAWTATEDQILTDFIKIHGEGRWRNLPKKAGLKRCGKSCRLRWLNYLRPDIIRGNISPDEEELIIRLHKLLGNRWSLIAGRLPGRTDNEIKNYWNTNLGKRVQNNPNSISIRSEKNTKRSSEREYSPENASPSSENMESPVIRTKSENFSQVQEVCYNNSDIKPTINGEFNGYNSLLSPAGTDFMNDFDMDALCFSDILNSGQPPEMLPEQLLGDWTLCLNEQNVASFLDSGTELLGE